MIVGRYGLHIAPGNIPFLHEKGKVQNLISPSLKSPFEVHIQPRYRPAPHDLDLSALTDVIPDWTQERLASYFLPIPRKDGEPAGLLLDEDGRYKALIEQLCELASPTEPLFRPVWWRPAREAKVLYGVTNLGPLVWIDAEVGHSPDIERHVDLAHVANRKILIVSKQRLPLFERYEKLQGFTLDPDQNLRQIGATCLVKHMKEIQDG